MHSAHNRFTASRAARRLEGSLGMAEQTKKDVGTMVVTVMILFNNASILLFLHPRPSSLLAIAFSCVNMVGVRRQ